MLHILRDIQFLRRLRTTYQFATHNFRNPALRDTKHKSEEDKFFVTYFADCSLHQPERLNINVLIAYTRIYSLQISNFECSANWSHIVCSIYQERPHLVILRTVWKICKNHIGKKFCDKNKRETSKIYTELRELYVKLYWTVLNKNLLPSYIIFGGGGAAHYFEFRKKNTRLT